MTDEAKITREQARKLVSELLIELSDPEDRFGAVLASRLAGALHRRTGISLHRELGYKKFQAFVIAECPDVRIEPDPHSTDALISLLGADGARREKAPGRPEPVITPDASPRKRLPSELLSWVARRYSAPNFKRNAPDPNELATAYSERRFVEVVDSCRNDATLLTLESLEAGLTKRQFSTLAALLASDAELCAEDSNFEVAADLYLVAMCCQLGGSRLSTDPHRYCQFLAAVNLGPSALDANANEIKQSASSSALVSIALGLGRASALAEEIANALIDDRSPLMFAVRENLISNVLPKLIPSTELKAIRPHELQYRAFSLLGESIRKLFASCSSIATAMHASAGTDLPQLGKKILQAAGQSRVLFHSNEIGLFELIARSLGGDLTRFSRLLSGSEEIVDSIEFLNRYSAALTEQLRRLDAGSLTQSTLFAEALRYVAVLVKSTQSSVTQQKRPNLKVISSTKRFPLEQTDRDHRAMIEIANLGSGPAEAVRVAFSAADAGTALLRETDSLGSIPPDDSRNSFLEFRMNEPRRAVRFDLSLKYSDLFGSEFEVSHPLVIEDQGAEPDWDQLLEREPYTLEPIANPAALRGRDAHLDQLRLNVRTSTSTILWGQKRVGKSSVARVLFSELSAKPGLLCIYTTKGDLAGYDEGALARDIAERIVARAKSQFALNKEIQIPTEQEFAGRITRLTRVIDALREAGVSAPIVLMIDEFDELNQSFYRGQRGENFFGTIRALSERRIVFVLVGSEQLPGIFRRYSQQLNKFDVLKLDTIKDTNDLHNMIREPVAGFIEYDPEAVRQIAYLSGGNPYYVNLLASRLLRSLVTSRRAYVDPQDVREIGRQISEDGSPVHWSHLWQDNDADDDLHRRKQEVKAGVALSGFAEGRADVPVGKSDITECLGRLGPDEPLPQFDLDQTLVDLTDRGILLCDETAGTRYSTAVPLFRRWLRRNARSQLFMRYKDQLKDPVEREPVVGAPTAAPVQIDISFAFPLSDEDLIAVAEGLMYRGKQVDAMTIKEWLKQFRSDDRIVLAFKLLKALRHRGYIDEGKLGRLHDKAYAVALEHARKIGVTPTVIRTGKSSPAAIAFRQQYLQRDSFSSVTANFCISYIGSGTKSGAQVARAIKKSKRLANSQKLESIPKWLARGGVNNADRLQQFVIVVDDFVGSGYQAAKALEEFLERARDDKHTSETMSSGRLVYVPLVAHSVGLQALGRKIASEIPILPVEKLDETDQAFNEQAELFDSSAEMRMAESICGHIGGQLNSDHPLGWENLQLLTVFPDTVPNATLPIFWRSGLVDEIPWTPLFPR